jgi:hypothetical protein
MFLTPDLIFGGTEGVQSRFHQLRVRRVLLSCFVRLDSFLAVPRETSLVFIFYAPGLLFGVTGSGGSLYHILRSRTPFRR